MALGAQENMQPAIAEPPLLSRQLPQPAAQGVVSRSAGVPLETGCDASRRRRDLGAH